MIGGSTTRRHFLKGAALATGALALNRPKVRAKMPDRPNILFLFADDQRFDTIGALNNSEIHTPTMDSIARSGTTFTHCYIQGSMNGAVCVASRSMLLTGRSLFRSPEQPSLQDGFPLWSEVFRENGYTTFATGKWHSGKSAFVRCFDDGGSIFFGGMHRMEDGGHLEPRVFDFNSEGNYPHRNSYKAKRFSSDLYSDAVIGFLREHKGTKPFLAYVSYTAPHDPRMAPSEYEAMYPPENIRVPENFLPEHPFDNGDMRLRDEQLAPWPRTHTIVREHIAAYYAMITHLDAAMGRVLKALEESVHARNTVVIFSSDNGLAVGQHGLLGKQNMYEHSLRVPLIVSGPGIKAGKKAHGLVYLHDLFPTTCDLVGLNIPGTVESKSLAPILEKPRRRVRTSLFGAYKKVQRMTRDNRFKLIVYPQVNETQLFDLAKDPLETKNLLRDADYREKAAQLREVLWNTQRDLDDPLFS